MPARTGAGAPRKNARAKGDPLAASSLMREQARAENEVLAVRMAKLRLAEAHGALCSRAEVEQVIGEMAVRARTKLMGIPEKLQAEGCPAAWVARIEALAREALEELARKEEG